MEGMNEAVKKRALKKVKTVAVHTVLGAGVGLGLGALSAAVSPFDVFGESSVRMRTSDLERVGVECAAQLSAPFTPDTLPEACEQVEVLFQTAPGSDVYQYDLATFTTNLESELRSRNVNDRDTTLICLGGGALICFGFSMSGGRRPEE